MPKKNSGPTYTPQMLGQIVSNLNEVARNDGTKKFQDQIFLSGTFGILCPIDNQIIYPKFNFYQPNPVAVIYYFEAAENLTLISEYISCGSPIVAAVTKTNMVQAEVSKGRKIPDKIIDVALSSLSGPPPSTPRIDFNLNPKLYCGHHNFAHFFRNELSTVDRSIFGTREIDTYILKDPFNLRMRRPYSGKLSPIEVRDAERGWKAGMVFLGTSTCLPDRVRSRFLHSIMNGKKQKINRIYISVRPDFIQRSLLNQEDFLRELIQAFHEKYGNIEFVLDGFSTPEDLERSAYSDYMREQYSEIVKQSRDIISNIARAVKCPEKNILDITGMNLSAALEIISSCSYYVCHADTQLNKIATLFPRRGFVHSNQHRITDSYMNWVASLSECTILATAINSENVENVNSGWKAEGRALRRKENYIIKDIDLAVSQVLDHYSQYDN